MDSLILAVNPGSSSMKAALFKVHQGVAASIATWNQAVSTDSEFQSGLEKVLRESFSKGRLVGIGCRVVDGGPSLTESAQVDEKVLKMLTQAADMAPLHSRESLATIKTVRETAAAIPIVAVFDTTFHRSIPEVASTYALPLDLIRSHKIKRYGFHGLVYQSVVRALRERGTLPPKLIACQLGSGSSACAILNGVSVDTTMGFTPLEGFVMGSRSGSLDPGILLYLLNHGYDRDSLGRLLNKESGLLGLSGRSSDMRELEKLSGEGDRGAQIALDVFYHSAAKQIASQSVALGGVDAISFSGGIGEHSAQAREKICNPLRFLGIDLDPEKNRREFNVFPANLATRGSKPIWIIPASEEQEIALEVVRIVGI